MDIWTFFVDYQGELYEIQIDKNKTFSEFRRKTSEITNVPFNDLVLLAGVEYNRDFNSKIIGEINTLGNGTTFYLVVKIMGGNWQ